MKLYEVPRGSLVRILTSESPPPGGIPAEAGETYRFSHIDGMYSYCTDKADNVVHLMAWTDVEILP
jgi:hypothetical protein